MSISRNLSIFADTVATSGNAVSSVTIPVLNGSTTLALQTGSTGAMYIDASQNVGVGNTSPSYKLDVTGTARATTSVISPIVNGATTLSLQTGGTTGLYLDASQNVGIGTTSSARSALLTVKAANQTITSGSGQLSIMTNNAVAADVGGALILGGQSAGSVDWVYGSISGRSENNAYAGYLALSTSSAAGGHTERMRIDSSGNVGIGTTSPLYKLHVSGSGSIYNLITNTGTGPSNLFLGAANAQTQIIARDATTGAVPTVFLQGTTESMRIDSSGNLLVGRTTNSFGNIGVAIQPAGTMYVENTDSDGISIRRNNGGVQIAFYTGSSTLAGTISSSGTSTAYITSSDYRLKENVQPMTTGLAIIGALNPVTYDWTKTKEKGEGFIAHELQSVIPLAVTGEKDAVNEDGTIKAQGVDYSKIVVHLVAALQELTAEVNALKAKVSA